MTDEEILAVLFENTEAGMQHVFDKYVALVYKIVLQKTKDICSKEDIEETVSDVFVDFYNSFERIDFDKGSLMTFLITIANRKAIDSFRRKTRNHIWLLSCDDENAKEISHKSDTEDKILDAIERDFLLTSVLGLGEIDSVIVIRKYFFGETCKEIGKHLGMTANAVNKRLKRSLRKLKVIMEGANYNE